MSGLDVEALLDSTASNKEQMDIDPPTTTNGDADQNGSKSERRDRDTDRDKERGDRDGRGRDASRDRGRRHRDRSSGRLRNSSSEAGRDTPRSEAGSHRSRRRSRSRESGRHSRRHRDGDYYRGRGGRSRSRSPNRYYRPRGDDRRERGGDSYRRRDDDRRSGRNTPRTRDGTPPPLTEDERDRRTVFVQQLAARLRTRELKEFFEKVGPVAEAQIVKDRVSNRSKGYVTLQSLPCSVYKQRLTKVDSVGYVEFKNEDSVQAALQLTGQKLLGIPVIVQLTEAEKNRQVRTTESTGHHPNSIPFHRLYVGNIHFSITEQDLQNVFEPFGELEFVQLQKDDNGRSRGYGFVQYVHHFHSYSKT